MEINKKVSVVVPVYNVEKYLPTCIDSLINQTYQNLEIILVDDGSKDQSGKICDDYAKKDQRIIVVHKENGGLSDARNAGIDKATGEYLAFIDSDDWVDRSMIEKMVEGIEKKDSDIVICNVVFCYEDREDERKGGYIENEDIILKNSIMKKLYENQTFLYVIACNKLYRKSIFEHIRYPKGYLHEDAAVIHHLYEKCKSIYLLPDKLYYYRQHERSIMGNGFSIKRIDLLVALSDRISFSHKIKNEELEKKTLIEYDDVLWKIINDVSDFYKDKKYAKRLKKSLRRIIFLILKRKELSLGHRVYALLMTVNFKLYIGIYKSARLIKGC